jgi:hypothetical protein
MIIVVPSCLKDADGARTRLDQKISKEDSDKDSKEFTSKSQGQVYLIPGSLDPWIVGPQGGSTIIPPIRVIEYNNIAYKPSLCIFNFNDFWIGNF